LKYGATKLYTKIYKLDATNSAGLFWSCAMKCAEYFVKALQNLLPIALLKDSTNWHLESRGLSYHYCEWMMMWRMTNTIGGSMMTNYNPYMTLGMERDVHQ
jgi:hypothetical protein